MQIWPSGLGCTATQGQGVALSEPEYSTECVVMDRQAPTLSAVAQVPTTGAAHRREASAASGVAFAQLAATLSTRECSQTLRAIRDDIFS
jgi:hypothetical protein